MIERTLTVRARPQLIATAAAALWLLAACSSTSPDSRGVAPTPAATATISPPISDLPTATSIVTSAAAAPITAPTSTTLPSSTTVPIEDQVRAAMHAYYEYYWVCLREPVNCDPAVIDLPASDAFNALDRTRNELIDGGFYVGSEDVGYLVIESVEVKADHMLVTSCWNLTAVLYGPPPFEGGDPTIQNNTPGWGREATQFVQDPSDGRWKIRRSDSLGDHAEENQCPPEQ